MDRNSLIGLGLIGAILIGWMYFTAPSKEEIERNKRVRDSIALAEQKKAEEIVKTQTIQKQKDSLFVKGTVDSVSALPDSILKIKKEQELVSNFRDFAPAASGKDEEFVLENNLIKVFVSSKGGKIKSVELKNFSRP